MKQVIVLLCISLYITSCSHIQKSTATPTDNISELKIDNEVSTGAKAPEIIQEDNKTLDTTIDDTNIKHETESEKPDQVDTEINQNTAENDDETKALQDDIEDLFNDILGDEF